MESSVAESARLGERFRRGLRAPGTRYRLHQSAIDILILFVVLQSGSVIYSLLYPDKFAYTNRANIEVALQTIPLLGIPALGTGILMIAGEFDLSLGANYVFSSILFAQWYGEGLNVWLAALLGLAVGAGVGVINGLITLRLRIPSFIATLGTFGIFGAATLLFHGAASQPFTPPSRFASLTAGSIWIIPSEFFWFVAIAVVCWLLLQRHRVGNHIFAAGGRREAAVATGVRVGQAKLLAFALAGFCAALAGIVAASRLGNIAPTTASDLPLQAIAACVIGGVLLTGGRGTILGICLGAGLIYWIQDVLLLRGAPGFYISAFVGALTIGAAFFYETLRARRG